jgi:hydrogenase expression/formation protein HypD
LSKNEKELVQKLARNLCNYKGRTLKIMEVCGTHTMAIFKHGIRNMLPQNIELISGPGCPVCVTSQGFIDNIVDIAKCGAIITTFGDMMRVPGSETSLEKTKAQGADVRVVYSPLDALKIAESNPPKNVIFTAVGFETTIPVIALTIKKARKMELKNIYFLSEMKLIIPALRMLCEDKELKIDGFLLPGHVSSIIGMKPYEFLAAEYSKACAISGFEAYDILLALNLILNQIKKKKFAIENGYKRAVRDEGNIIAYNTIFEVFEPTDSIWRGIGKVQESGLKFKEEYKNFDAKSVYKLKEHNDFCANGCICGEVIKGVKTPLECKLFGRVCNTLNPIGACMVSSEGTCAAYYKYKNY